MPDSADSQVTGQSFSGMLEYGILMSGTCTVCALSPKFLVL